MTCHDARELFSALLDETLTLVRARAGIDLALRFGEAIWRRGGAEVIDVGATSREAAWDIFRRYRDHALSFTDCTSVAVMRQRGIDDVLTLDAHFAVFGFRAMPER